jgi:hypothetical protein
MFLLYFFSVLSANNMFSYFRTQTTSHHPRHPPPRATARRVADPLPPPPTRRHSRPRATACGMDPLLCHRAQGAALPLPGPPRLPHHLAWGHNGTATNNCSWGGSLPQPRRRRRSVVIVISSCIRKSPQLRVFSDAGAVGERHSGSGSTPTHSDPWLVTRGLRVRVRVRSKVPAGYPCICLMVPRDSEGTVDGRVLDLK